MDVKNLNKVEPFTTKDGSEIRELLAHRNSAIRHQSLAEARLPVGGATQEHFHPRAEEIYYLTHGAGKIRNRNGSAPAPGAVFRALAENPRAQKKFQTSARARPATPGAGVLPGFGIPAKSWP